MNADPDPSDALSALPFDRLREKCAVFGIFDHPEAANMTYLGLYALQHRGQEGCGIASMDQGKMIIRKGEGLVSEFFHEPVIAELRGRSAVGHNRYSTAGSDSFRNLQPLSAYFSNASMALVHNGNLTNALELRKKLEEEGALFTTDVDTEVLVHMIARSRGVDFASRMEDALGSVKGSYSLLALTPTSLIGIRDPLGFRPLSIGKVGDVWVMASETCAFDLIGATFIRDVEPGEMVVVTAAGLESFRLFPRAPSAACIFELIYFSRPDSRVFGIPVYQARKQLGKRLAIDAPVEADLVIPVPDSGLAPALGYSEQSGIPLDMGLIRNHYVGRTFIEPQQSIRHFGVKIKLNAVPDLLRGKRVVVIDDSIVRGTTSRKIVSMLREAGAKEVHMRITSAPINFPCFYGIDTPNRGELIASSHNLDEIRRYLKADSLAYLSIAAMEEEIQKNQTLPEGDPQEVGTFCKACFDGNYPIAFTQEERIQHGIFDRQPHHP